MTVATVFARVVTVRVANQYILYTMIFSLSSGAELYICSTSNDTGAGRHDGTRQHNLDSDQIRRGLTNDNVGNVLFWGERLATICFSFPLVHQILLL